MANQEAALDNLFSLLFQAHPWHGVAPSDAEGELGVVKVFVEIVPSDAVKYELEKESGHLQVDRPQRFSSLPPTLYGFVPQTYCGDEVAELCRARTGVAEIEGDRDPLDICIFTEKSFAHGDFFLRAAPIGGIRMIDGIEADDKIIAVMKSDIAYGHIEDISELPSGLLDRLQHYFLTYKQLPQDAPRRVEIAGLYDRDEALDVIARSVRDYRKKYGAPENRLQELRRLLANESQVSSLKTHT